MKKRPAVCDVCGERLYYKGDPEWEDEYNLDAVLHLADGKVIDLGVLYIHRRCLPPISARNT